MERMENELNQARKESEAIRSPASPSSAVNSAQQAPAPSTPTRPEAPASPVTVVRPPPNATPGETPTPSTPSKPDTPAQPPIDSTTQATPKPTYVGAHSAARAAEWMGQQDRSSMPNAAKLNSQVKDFVRLEDSSRNFEEIMDGSEHQLDPRTSFRKTTSEKSAVPSAETISNWKKMLTSNLDPRRTFRRVVSVLSGMKPSEPKVTSQPAPTTEPKASEPAAAAQSAPNTESNATPSQSTASEQESLHEPTLRRLPETWLEKFLADYPGSPQHDMAMLLLILLIIVLLLALAFIALTASVHFYKDVQPACAYCGVSAISALGPSLHLPDFCAMKESYEITSTSPIVLDPLGLNLTLKWALTVPQLKEFDHKVSHPALPFKPINEAELHQSVADLANNSHITALFQSSIIRGQATQTLQKSFTNLTIHYDTLITSLLDWSAQTPQDLKTIAHSSTGLKQTLLLLWGPLIGSKTPLGEIKEHLRLPVQSLLESTKLLTDTLATTISALQFARKARKGFRLTLVEAREFFIENCVEPNPFCLPKIREDPVCRGWNPVTMKRELRGVEVGEDELFDALQRVLGVLEGAVGSLGGFYREVLGELEDVKGRTFGDIRFDSLDALRGFVERLGVRMGGTAGELRVKMGK